MIGQRSGQIVNTASLAGLIPAPRLTPYAMTKDAVVGLSLSLEELARQDSTGHFGNRSHLHHHLAHFDRGSVCPPNR